MVNQRRMEHSELLRRYRVELMETVDVQLCPLMDYLLSRGVVTPAIKQRIEANYKANIDQVGQLIDYLSRRPYEDYLTFRDALCQTNQKHVVDRFLPQDGKVSTVEAQEAQGRSTSTGAVAQAPVMPADEMDTIRHDLAALSIKQSRGAHKPEEDKISFTFSNSCLEIESMDTSQHIKPLLSTTKLQEFLNSILPVQVEAIRTHLVNLDQGCCELFTFVTKCKRCKRLMMEKTKDNSEINVGIIKGLQFALHGLGNLLELDIRDTYLGEGGRQVLSSLSRSCPHLRALTLIGDHLAGCGPQLAACLTSLPLLAYLNLINSGLTSEEMPGVLDSLAVSCPQLVALLLPDNDLSQAADALTHAVQAKSLLKILSINNCKLDSIQLTKVLEKTSVKLEYTHIWGNAVCTEVETELVRLTEQRPSLRYVAMNKSQVSGDAWDRMECVLRVRGGYLYVCTPKSEGYNSAGDYLNVIRDECLKETQ